MRLRQQSQDHITFTGRGVRGLLLATAAVPALLLSVPAAAQTETAPPAEEQAAEDDNVVVVTGIRSTVRSSIARKQEETAIVDALSSEEIGDLPALSVGEAIQTITGATTHREKGGASEIAIRGLGPFLSNSTFNGRDATNGSGDRSVNFNQFPSELVNGIAIYKTQQANLIEGGVAGTIEIETLRPLDYGRRRIQGEVKFNYSPYQDNIRGEDGLGWRGTLSYVDQFNLGAAGELGISLGIQRNQTANPEQTLAGSSTWTACDATVVVTNNNCREVTRAEVAAGRPYYFAPNSFATRQIVEDDRRDALFGAIQWQPSPGVEINLDLQYSDRVFNEQRNDLNLSEMRRSLRNVTFTPYGTITRAEGQSTIETNSTLQTRAEEYLGGGLDVAVDVTERLKVAVDLSYSRTHRVETDRTVRLRSDAMDINGVRTAINNQRIPYVYEVLPGNFAPTITIDPRYDVTNADLFSAAARLRRDEDSRLHEIVAGRIDATYDMDGFFDRIDAGVRLARMTYNDYSDRVETNLTNRTQIRDANLACRRPFPEEDFLSSARGNAITGYATFDPVCLFQSFLGTADPGRNDDVRSVANRDVEEQTVAGYVMATYNSQIGSLPVRGNFGLRVVNTQVTSVGLRSGLDVVNNPDGTIRLVQTGDFEEVVIESENTRFLPSINAIFELRPDVLFRLAGYRAMSRPNPSALGAGREIDLDVSDTADSIEEAIANITANGSPRLEPLMSWNADASLEWYPNRDTMVAGALYYKNFTGGFIPVVIDEQFTIDGQQVTVPVVQTANSDEQSSLWGFELTLAHTFSWLPAPLDGLGAKLSYNYASSNFETQDVRYGDVLNPVTGVVTPGFIEPANVFGLSEHVVSAQAFYEKGPFSIQAVYNYRSNYYQDFVGGNTQLRYVRDNETVDLRASFDINRNISLRAEAVNLFDEPKVTDMPVQGSIRQYHYYGPRYFLGVRFRI
ncbi:MAG: TonB-dependent receptor [Allosphingosinicella sp.]|uniref:TonB-dependent receptor n=1 Tax=Allosphingosinicella sp. TaxID=2823234 RepID=UPI0039499E36